MSTKENIQSISFGLLFCILIAATATLSTLFPNLREIGLGPHTIAIILGVIIANIAYFQPIIKRAKPGIAFCKLWILKTAVVLYGFRLAFEELIEIGSVGLFVDALILTTTFFLTYYIGVKLLNMDEKEVILIGTGSSICGSAAILATAPVIHADSGKVTVAIGTVVLFGTIAIFFYPYLYDTGFLAQLGFNDQLFGIFAGGTVHSVTTVAGATAPINQTVATVALTTKLLKVSMLAPFLLILGYFLNRRDNREKGSSKVTVPWFALMFIVVVGFNSLHLLPRQTVDFINNLDNFLLITALVGLGLSTELEKIKRSGLKPLLLATISFSWLLFGGLIIELFVVFIRQLWFS